jgi:fucose 4-O-acetylase-like acetyltransferase
MSSRTVPKLTSPPSATTDDDRNGYVDLLRGASIVAVVIGHWLATGVVHRDGHYLGVDALGVISWSGWITLLLQVVPVFFLVGGYANAGSWSRHQPAGQAWSSWVHDRAVRLLAPTWAYLAVIATVIEVSRLRHGDPRSLQQAGWAVALHLWFLAAYLVVLLWTPLLYAAHRRWKLAVPAVMGLLAVMIDTGVVDFRWHIVGWANYLLVWGTFHQLGFAWHDGNLSVRRATLVAGAAVVTLVGLIGWGPYPVSMVGSPGARIMNASPPSTALLAFGLAQSGLLIAAEPRVTRWLARHRRARSSVARLGPLTMPVYLWHMVPVVIVIEAGYLGVLGQPNVGSGTWWAQRPAWIAALVVVLSAVLAVVGVVVRLSRRRRIRHSVQQADRSVPTFVSVALLVAGITVAAVGIGYLSIHGFARHGYVDPFPLIAVAAGSALLVISRSRIFTTAAHETAASGVIPV